MQLCGVLALLSGSLALALLLVALSTDNWIAAESSYYWAHSGLWHPDGDSVKDFILATRVFMILAALEGLLSICCLILFLTPTLCNSSFSHLASLIFCITAFAAGEVAGEGDARGRGGTGRLGGGKGLTAPIHSPLQHRGNDYLHRRAMERVWSESQDSDDLCLVLLHGMDFCHLLPFHRGPEPCGALERSPAQLRDNSLRTSPRFDE